MKLRFDPDQPHQRAAIDAVLGVLRGQPRVSTADALRAGAEHGVVANHLSLAPHAMWHNVHRVQRAAGLALTEPEAAIPQLSVEMETGTGKTYVYLRTVLELAQRHGLRKAVVVVPSVAVREGVLKTLRITAEHFAALLPGLHYRFFAYDGNRLDRLRAFTRSSEVELMVLTLDAFNKARNRMRHAHDAFAGRTPLALLQATRPLLVLDEPQRMESPRSRAALADLQPSVVLRYGATHRVRHALVHRLTPRQAHVQGLVKRIEVAAPAAGVHDRVLRIEAQVQATVRQHLRRQAELAPRGVKVLSLLFVERVDDWIGPDAVVRQALTRSFDALKHAHPTMAGRTAQSACAAYFAVQRRRGGACAVDSRTGHSAADADAYALIMRDKERLLSMDEPVCFVVSHSALREGWDNPNVFQICTLAPSRSQTKKRQEIGRGVRLAVDHSGQRVHDPVVNVLTVVANDSYEDYVAGLQAEDAAGVDEAAMAPTPRPAGTASPAVVVPPGPEPAAPWWAIDTVRLRADAAAGLAVGSQGSAGATVADPVAAITERLLRSRPPQLVGRATIEAVLAECGTTDELGWVHVDAVVEALRQALQRQRPALEPEPK